MDPSPVYNNIDQLLSALGTVSTWQADRIRRLIDSGCPKEKVREICQEPAYFMREESIDTEEKKLYLIPMDNSKPTDYQKMEYELAHQKRVIERMKEREEWFQERIAQLEKFGTRVATELSELKKKHPEPPPAPEPVSISPDGRPPPLNLSSSIPHHERVASVCRKSVLEEDNMVGGMTPTLPLLPIPTHSLKKQVSWHEISASQEVATSKEETPYYGQYLYCEEGAETHRPSVGGTTDK